VNPPTSSASQGLAWGGDDDDNHNLLATTGLASGLDAQGSFTFDTMDLGGTSFPFLPMAMDSGMLGFEPTAPEPADNTGELYHATGTSINPHIYSQNQLSDVAEGGTHGAQVPGDQNYLSAPLFFTTYERQPCLEFPICSSDQLQTAEAEVFGHVAEISSHSLQQIQSFYNKQRGCSSSRFINSQIFHAFIELYLEHFNTVFPFIHNSRVRNRNMPWILLLALAAVGSQYSGIQGVNAYHLLLQDLLSRALETHVCIFFSRSPSTADKNVVTTEVYSCGCQSHSESLFAPHSALFLRIQKKSGCITM
jgi:hypothetical protein